MIIEKTDTVAKKQGAGRPAYYPFDQLQPGMHIKLVFSVADDIKRAATQVSSALANFKRRNDHEDWQTKVRREGFDIYVYRIK